MDEASYEARKRPLESDLPEQIEFRVRRERRRRWTTVDKLRIVEEAFAPGAVAKRVAERHEISTGLLFTWRRQLMVEASARFQPVHLIADPEVAPAAPSDSTPCQDGKIEIEMRSGVRVRVGHGADLKVLRGVLTILDGR
jgi:transposase